ncbi:MAG: PAS domain S-box protein [Chloroflexi bacterium]|nr:PAS domain S-box protein [Chloroflexota bacterium]
MIAKINEIISDIVDEDAHSVVRQRLLETIAQAVGFEFAMLSETFRDGNQMKVTAIYEETKLMPAVEKILGFPLIGYHFEIDADYRFSAPPAEVFTHISDYHTQIPKRIGSSIGKILNIKRIVLVRQYTGDQYLGAVTFATKETDPKIDLLTYLCNNHLVYALRLIREQAKQARQRENHTRELEKRINERTDALKTAHQQVVVSQEILSESYIDLEQTRQVAEARLQETEMLLNGLKELTDSSDIDGVFTSMLYALQAILGYEDAFILNEKSTDIFELISTTSSKFERGKWYANQFFKRILSGKILAAFNTMQISEWQEQDSDICAQAVSALHIPLVTQNSKAILICTHSVKGFFTRKHIELAERFSILAIQALSKSELYIALEHERDQLESTVGSRTAELVEVNQTLEEENAERRLAEETALESEKRYRSLFERTHDAVFFLSLDDICLEANQQAADMLDYKIKEVIGKNIYDIVASHYHETTRKNFKSLLSGDISPIFPCVFYKKDGTEFPVEINAAMVYDSEGQPIHIQSVVRDITERTKAKDALQEAEQKLRSLFDNSPDFILLLDQAGNIQFVNHVEESPSPEEVIGAHVYNFIPAEQHDLYRENLEKTFLNNEVITIEHQALERWYISRFVPIAGDEAVTSVMVIASDITERKQTEEEIAILAKFPAENPNPILRVTHTGEIIYANPSSAPLLSVWNSNPGQKLPDYVFERCLDDSKQPKIILTEFEVENQIFALSFVPIKEMGYINIYGRNITAEKESDRIKADFVASVSHELRTPLAPILGWSEILLDEAPGEINEEQREFLQAIYDGGIHLQQIVYDLLDATSMEAGSFRLEMEEFGFQDVAQKSVKFVLSEADKKQISLKLAISPKIPKIQADPKRIEQVFVNLLSNAVKFTSENGEISLRADICQEDGWVEISVQDSGMGIPEDALSKIFDRFYRSEDAVSANIQGTGLGLYISKKIIKGHGGTIDVRSTIGKGSVFEIRLPVEKLEA